MKAKFYKDNCWKNLKQETYPKSFFIVAKHYFNRILLYKSVNFILKLLIIKKIIKKKVKTFNNTQNIQILNSHLLKKKNTLWGI